MTLNQEEARRYLEEFPVIVLEMDLSRRKFVIGLTALLGKVIAPSMLLAANNLKPFHVVLPPKPKQSFYKEGRRKGGNILIIGGIHGNEPGAYKAVDILSRLDVIQGRLILIPRSNFTSILANVRGYNGDMNRKFASLNKTDPDFPWVCWLKEHICLNDVNVVLSLHDGAGFHIRNKRAWGECIVIDEANYKEWSLYQTAAWVIGQVNKDVESPWHRFSIYNTHTFSPFTTHREQRKSLTYYTLTRAKKPAFCLEVSKQLPSLYLKVKYHLLMLSYFFKLYRVKTDPPLEYVISNLERYLYHHPQFRLVFRINNHPLEIRESKTIKIPPKSEVKLEKIYSENGVFVSPVGINLNWQQFRVYNCLQLNVKQDFQTMAKIKFLAG